MLWGSYDDWTTNQIKSLKYFPPVIMGVIFMLGENEVLTVIFPMHYHRHPRSATTKQKRKAIQN